MPTAAPMHRTKLQRRNADKKPVHNWNREGTTAERGYGYQWQLKRERILKRDKRLCQPHLRRGLYKAASEVDHIKEKSDGGTDEDSNLESTCRNCHKTKTSSSNKKRRYKRKKKHVQTYV